MAAAAASSSSLGSGVPFLLHSPARPQQGCLCEGQGQGPVGRSEGTCMRGLGCGGDLGPTSPHLWLGERVIFPACREREEGACPRLGRAVVAFRLFPMDCTEGSEALKLPQKLRVG